MHIPSYAQNLKDTKSSQIRLALLGMPSTGKTWSALTFPNPIMADFDNKLGAHLGKDIPRIPFYDAEFVDTTFKIVRAHPSNPPNRRDAFIKFLKTDAQKLTEEQTLIIDSFSNLEIAFDQQQSLEKALTDRGKEDKFVFWAKKKEFYGDLCNLLKSLKCNVVAVFHECYERNDDGDLTGKLKPVMTGSFKDQILGHFTDIYRQVTSAKKDAEGKVIGSEYWWQIKSDNVCNCGVSINKLLVDTRARIPATYQSLI